MPPDRRRKAKGATAKKSGPALERVATDVLLRFQPDEIKRLLQGSLKHVFRQNKLGNMVVRLWLYEAQVKAIRYVVDIGPGTTGVEEDDLTGDSAAEASSSPKRYSYPVRRVLKVRTSPGLTAARLKAIGVSVPLSWAYLPLSLFSSVDLDAMVRVLPQLGEEDEDEEDEQEEQDSVQYDTTIDSESPSVARAGAEDSL